MIIILCSIQKGVSPSKCCFSLDTVRNKRRKQGWREEKGKERGKGAGS